MRRRHALREHAIKYFEVIAVVTSLYSARKNAPLGQISKLGCKINARGRFTPAASTHLLTKSLHKRWHVNINCINFSNDKFQLLFLFLIFHFFPNNVVT